MFDDFDDDDFADLGARLAPKSSDLVLSCVRMGRTSTPRVQFNFAPAVLAEIGGDRYSIGFAIARRSAKRGFRIVVDPVGRFEAYKPGRGDRRILRCPMPAVGFAEAEGSAEPEFFVDRIGRAILVEVPDLFIPARPRALPAPAEDRTTMPGSDDEVRLAVDRRMREMLVGDAGVPQTIAGQSFTPSERQIIAALLSHPQIRREGLLAACHDPEKGEDDRDPNIVDVFMSKMRGRLRILGVEIERVGVGAYRFGLDSKLTLKRLITDATVGSS